MLGTYSIKSKLFHPNDISDLPIDPPDIREYFRKIEKGERKLPDILSSVLIRRTRNHILRWYGFDAQTEKPVNPSDFKQYLDGRRKAYVLVGGNKQFFPKRILETVSYSIEDTYQGLYHELRELLGETAPWRRATSIAPGELTYARYGLWHYVLESKQKQEPYISLQRSGANLRGLMRVLLFKRFESSVYAFKQTIKKLLNVHQLFAEALENGIVPAGDEAQSILYEPSAVEEQELMDALEAVSGRYRIDDFNIDLLQEHLDNDIKLLSEIMGLVDPITPDRDAKLQTLKNRLSESPLSDGKRLIFTQYADTARYLFDNLNPNSEHDDIDVIFSGDRSKERAVGRFAPRANPEYRFVSVANRSWQLSSPPMSWRKV